MRRDAYEKMLTEALKASIQESGIPSPGSSPGASATSDHRATPQPSSTLPGKLKRDQEPQQQQPPPPLVAHGKQSSRPAKTEAALAADLRPLAIPKPHQAAPLPHQAGQRPEAAQVRSQEQHRPALPASSPPAGSDPSKAPPSAAASAAQAPVPRQQSSAASHPRQASGQAPQHGRSTPSREALGQLPQYGSTPAMPQQDRGHLPKPGIPLSHGGEGSAAAPVSIPQVQSTPIFPGSVQHPAASCSSRDHVAGPVSVPQVQPVPTFPGPVEHPEQLRRHSSGSFRPSPLMPRSISPPQAASLPPRSAAPQPPSHHWDQGHGMGSTPPMPHRRWSSDLLLGPHGANPVHAVHEGPHAALQGPVCSGTPQMPMHNFRSRPEPDGAPRQPSPSSSWLNTSQGSGVSRHSGLPNSSCSSWSGGSEAGGPAPRTFPEMPPMPSMPKMPRSPRPGPWGAGKQ